MSQRPLSIPRPLVRTNQWTIFLSVVLTWLTGQYWILVIPLVANLLGCTIGFNPIIRGAKYFLRKDPKEYIPEEAGQQRFNSSIATICLAGGFIGFVTCGDVATRNNVGLATVHAWICQGRLDSVVVDEGVYIPATYKSPLERRNE